MIPGPGAFTDCAVFLLAAAQRADVGGEAAGTSINHSQVLLQRLQELLRQGNASDVVLRVQAAGTDEVRVFHAHRLLLGLHSQRFRELLRNQSEVLLQEPGDCAAVFDKFIRWGGDGFGGDFIPSQAPGSPTHGVPEALAPSVHLPDVIGRRMPRPPASLLLLPSFLRMQRDPLPLPASSVV